MGMAGVAIRQGDLISDKAAFAIGTGRFLGQFRCGGGALFTSHMPVGGWWLEEEHYEGDVDGLPVDADRWA